MAGRLEGKVAVITGGVSGIGLGSVELFLAEGAQVVAADIQDEKGAMLEKRFSGRLRYAHCDVTAEAEIAAALQLAKTEFGGLDILFNNAGISDGMRLITEIDADRWNWIFDILVRGPALGMKHAVPLMLERGGGSIVNTASIAGLQAGWGPIAYSSAKAAVIHMSKVAAAQLSPQGIRVNAICPGLIATSIFGASLGMPREGADQLAALVATHAHKVQPVPKGGAPEDIAQAALYLASDAAAFVTGTHLVVDGGITVGSRHAWDATGPNPFSEMFGNMFEQPAAAPAGE
jgi:NAD(P)-dependent dehydrogenase (short-subunit alcohol dehydrogenase family)